MMKVLVVDTNLGLEHARRIGEKFDVYYFIDVKNPYPKLEDMISGDGFKEIKKVYDEGEVLGEANVIVFTDIGFGAKADLLRKVGYGVFGASYKGEMLEKDRIYGKKIMERLGIDVTDYFVVKGKYELLKYLRQHRGKMHYVKVNNIRGNIETVGVKDDLEMDIVLSQAGFGIYENDLEFIVEKEAEGIEIGGDFWFNGEEFLDVHHFTMEVKGMGNIGKFVKDSVIKEQWADKLEGWLRKTGYRGMICIEGFWDGEKFKAMDVASRFPYPESVVMAKYIDNFPELIVEVALGNDVKVLGEGRYTAEIGIYTDNVDMWRVIDYDKDVEKDVGFRKAVKKYGKVWYVPGDNLIATASSYSLVSWDDAMEKAMDVSDRIKAIESSPSMGIMRIFEDRVKKLRDLGVNIF